MDRLREPLPAELFEEQAGQVWGLVGEDVTRQKQETPWLPAASHGHPVRPFDRKQW